MEVYVNGELYHRRDDLPYIKAIKQAPSICKIKAPVRISAANGSTVTVKSLSITRL